MLPSRYFVELTQPEIAAQLKKNPLVILPAGSVEQHGPHLPAGTDSFAANTIAHAVAERMDALVIPGTPLGVTPMHMPFEATITLAPDTYMRLVTDACVSTAKHGARYLLILNWHEGNMPSLALVAEALHREHAMTVLTVQACYVAEELYGKSCNGLTHGGEIEALEVLAERPELVHLDRIELPTLRTVTRWIACAAPGAFSRCSPTSARSRRRAGSAAHSTPLRRRAGA
ncbi:MAG: creatinine amidohydrolase [Alphaproteobacteria bacterium]|jgi:creatinine amidohydrolase|nr:creatinine amidohydrolase [Alphaproteobacteria bacterium]